MKQNMTGANPKRKPGPPLNLMRCFKMRWLEEKGQEKKGGAPPPSQQVVPLTWKQEAQCPEVALPGSTSIDKNIWNTQYVCKTPGDTQERKNHKNSRLPIRKLWWKTQGNNFRTRRLYRTQSAVPELLVVQQKQPQMREFSNFGAQTPVSLG